MSTFQQLDVAPHGAYMPSISDGSVVVASNPFDDPPQRFMGHDMPMIRYFRSSEPGPMQFRGQMPGPPGAVCPGGMPPGFMFNPASMGPRIYPADQPVVFSANNPNAPPIFPCGNCRKEIHENEQALQCELGCSFWYHRSCAGLNDDAYKLLNDEKWAVWVCEKCWITKDIPLVKLS